MAEIKVLSFHHFWKKNHWSIWCCLTKRLQLHLTTVNENSLKQLGAPPNSAAISEKFLGAFPTCHPSAFSQQIHHEWWMPSKYCFVPALRWDSHSPGWAIRMGFNGEKPPWKLVGNSPIIHEKHPWSLKWNLEMYHLLEKDRCQSWKNPWFRARPG